MGYERRAAMEIDVNTQGDITGIRDYMPDGEASDRPRPLIECSLDEQEGQLGALTATMRRVEELADRVCGAQVTGEGKSNETKRDFGQGIIAALRGVNADREQAITRINMALDRLGKIF